MTWFRRRSRRTADPAYPPYGVTLTVNGRVILCDVLRDESLDHHGLAVWAAVPRVSVTIGPEDDYRPEAAYLPDGCQVVMCAHLKGAGGGVLYGNWLYDA